MNTVELTGVMENSVASLPVSLGKYLLDWSLMRGAMRMRTIRSFLMPLKVTALAHFPVIFPFDLGREGRDVVKEEFAKAQAKRPLLLGVKRVTPWEYGLAQLHAQVLVSDEVRVRVF